MMDGTKLSFAMKHVIIVVTIVVNTVSTTSNSDSSVNADFEGRSLVAMGTAMNSPLLRLLGRTFDKLEQDVTKDIDNKTTYVLSEVKKDKSSLEHRLTLERKELIYIICQLHVCADWTQWSGCTAIQVGIYGTQKRSRTCGANGVKLCTNSGQIHVETETDARVCEGSKCPTNYTVTNNSFCISVHTDVKHDWTTAQTACKREGGYLVNVDSEPKAKDVSTTLQQMSRTDDFWIDGKRTLPSGAWSYEYSPKDPSYTNWKTGEPGSSDDCKAFIDSSNVWYWWGRECYNSYYFICEVI